MIPDDPRALVLWRQREIKPVLEVGCDNLGRHRHRLARLFNLPGEGQRLVTPRIAIEDRHLFPKARDADSIATFAAALYEIEGDGAILLRCNCATFQINRADLRTEAAGARQLGTWITATRTFRPGIGQRDVG